MGGRLSRWWWKAIAIGIVVVLAPVIWLSVSVLIDRLGSHEMSWGERIGRGEDYIYISEQTLTNEDLEYLASLRNLKMLRILDCNVAECRLRDLDFAGHEMWYVDFTGTTGLWDLSFLSTIRAESVILNDCSGIDDISMLNWDALDELEIDGTAVTDLSPLAGSKVMRVSFARTDVSDISPLASLGRQLWRVNGSYSKVESIDALADCENLHELTFDGCSIEQVKKPLAATRLYNLSLADTPVSDLSGFSGCDCLQKLNLRGTKITDMSWMNRQIRESLTELDFGQAELGASDVGWVAACTNLKRLTLDGIDLGNLDLCRSLTNLEWLSAIDCNLTDISGIRNCSKLTTVLLGYNKLQSISALPMHEDDWDRKIVDLSHNQLSSVSELPQGDYCLIMLQGNNADVARTLTDGVDSYMLVADWYAGIEDSVALTSRDYTTIYLLGCTKEAREVFEETPWKWWALEFVSENEVLDMLETDDMTFSHFEELGPCARLEREKLAEAGGQ
ncbi:MAG: hypothetical protein J6D34_00600 [Atopobiaceae bacterium]|nr:hypothetical protein [Atopobiaceae bacterium]